MRGAYTPLGQPQRSLNLRAAVLAIVGMVACGLVLFVAAPSFDSARTPPLSHVQQPQPTLPSHAGPAQHVVHSTSTVAPSPTQHSHAPLIARPQPPSMFHTTTAHEPDSLHMAVVVKTRPEDQARRIATRNTWATWTGDYNVRVFFAVAVLHSDDAILQMLLEENKEYHDLMLLHVPNFYGFFYHKFHLAMEFLVQQYSMVKYYAWVDDDMFVCLDRVLHDLELLPQNRLLYSEFRCMTGCPDEAFMIITWDLVQFLVRNTAYFRSLDVFPMRADEGLMTYLHPVALHKYHDTRIWHEWDEMLRGMDICPECTVREAGRTEYRTKIHQVICRADQPAVAVHRVKLEEFYDMFHLVEAERKQDPSLADFPTPDPVGRLPKDLHDGAPCGPRPYSNDLFNFGMLKSEMFVDAAAQVYPSPEQTTIPHWIPNFLSVSGSGLCGAQSIHRPPSEFLCSVPGASSPEENMGMAEEDGRWIQQDPVTGVRSLLVPTDGSWWNMTAVAFFERIPGVDGWNSFLVHASVPGGGRVQVVTRREKKHVVPGLSKGQPIKPFHMVKFAETPVFRPDIPEEEGQVRLVVTRAGLRGRLEVFYSGEWTAVDSSLVDFDHAAVLADVVCRQIGEALRKQGLLLSSESLQPLGVSNFKATPQAPRQQQRLFAQSALNCTGSTSLGQCISQHQVRQAVPSDQRRSLDVGAACAVTPSVGTAVDVRLHCGTDGRMSECGAGFHSGVSRAQEYACECDAENNQITLELLTPPDAPLVDAPFVTHVDLSVRLLP